MPSALKRGLRWAGRALAIAGAAFVVLRLRNYGVQTDLARLDSRSWTIISALAVPYGFANCLLALGWWQVLASLRVGVPRRWAMRAYGISQLAKYVPGNVFHLASRQALGLAAGLPGRELAKSVIWELALASVAGGLFGFLVLPLLWPWVPVPFALSAFVTVNLVVFFGVRHWLGSRVARALSFRIVFLALSGLVFLVTLTIVAGKGVVGPGSFLVYGGAYVVAWLAGLLTPGAPAGVGVREMVLLFLLNGRIVEADLLLAVILGRAITVMGDIGFFILALLIKSNDYKHL